MNEWPVRCEVDGQVRVGKVRRRDLTTQERATRALKIVGAFWTAAFLFVFVPILHFIIPPILILIGIGFGITTWLERGIIVDGSIECPNCKHELVLTPGPESWPHVQRCGYCFYTLTVTADTK